MSKDTASALAKTGETGFSIVDAPDAHEVMLGAFDQLGISNFQLNRIKVPAGGGTAWELESLEGQTVHPHLDCIILTIKGKQKAWWSTTMEEGGGGGPPSCRSEDGRTGIGVNTLEGDGVPEQHLCGECPWNQFGSARNGGNGKDCSDFSLLFVFLEGSRLPTLLTVPATSLRVLQNYVIKLIDANKRAEGVVTRLGLKKAQSKSGITYSVLDLSWQRDLDEEGTAKMHQISQQFRERISQFDAFSPNGDE